MPCDLDACLEYKNKGYVLIEAKYKDAPMPKGQELMYIRLADDLDRSGKPTMFLVAEHEQKDTDKDIDLANCRVRSCYSAGQYIDGYSGTVKQLYDAFVARLEK